MAIVKEVVTTETYKDAQGNDKKRYLRVGSIIETRNGEMLKLDTIPIGWNGWAYLNEPRQQGESDRPQREQRSERNPNAGSRSTPTQRQQPASASGDDFSDDDIPF